MKKTLFGNTKYRSLIRRLLVAFLIIGLSGVLILWDTGVFDLPFLTRRERRTPETQSDPSTKEETTEAIDYDRFAKDVVSSVYDFDQVEGAAALVTSLPFDPQNMTLVKQKLSGGSFDTRMGFVIKEDAKSLIFLAPDMKEIDGSENYLLTKERDANGNAVFQKKGENGYFQLDRATLAFSPSDFDPKKDSTGIDLALPASYGKGEEGTQLVFENGLYGYTGAYQDGRKTVSFTVEAQYPTAFAYSEGFAVMADKDGKVTIRSRQGEIVFSDLSLVLPEKEGEEALGFSYFDGGVLRVVIASYDAEGRLSSRRESVIDSAGKEISIPEGYSVTSLSEGVLVLTDGSHYGYFSSQGAWITSPIYTAASPFLEGLGAVTGEDGKMGLVDITGKEVLPCAFDLVTNMSDGNALCYSQSTGWHLLSKLQGAFGTKGAEAPQASSYHTKVTITRGPQNTFNYEPDEVIEFPPVLSTPSRTTHPEDI